MRKEKSRNKNQRKQNEITHIGFDISVNTLNLNCLNTLIKRQKINGMDF